MVDKAITAQVSAQYPCFTCAVTETNLRHKNEAKVTEPPEVLLIQANRVHHKQVPGEKRIRKKKITADIQIDEGELKFGGHLYQLAGFTVHQGGVDTGHYFTFTKDDDGMTWYLDDLGGENGMSPASSLCKPEDFDKYSKHGYCYSFRKAHKLPRTQQEIDPNTPALEDDQLHLDPIAPVLEDEIPSADIIVDELPSTTTLDAAHDDDENRNDIEKSRTEHLDLSEPSSTCLPVDLSTPQKPTNDAPRPSVIKMTPSKSSSPSCTGYDKDLGTFAPEDVESTIIDSNRPQLHPTTPRRTPSTTRKRIDEMVLTNEEREANSTTPNRKRHPESQLTPGSAKKQLLQRWDKLEMIREENERETAEAAAEEQRIQLTVQLKPGSVTDVHYAGCEGQTAWNPEDATDIFVIVKNCVLLCLRNFTDETTMQHLQDYILTTYKPTFTSPTFSHAGSLVDQGTRLNRFKGQTIVLANGKD